MFFPVASFSSAENITLRHDDVINVLILRHAKRANGRGVVLKAMHMDEACMHMGFGDTGHTGYFAILLPEIWDPYILKSWVLTHLSTILSLKKFTCKDGLSCTVYVTNERIVHQFMLLFFFCFDHTPENFKRKQTPVVHNIF